MTGKYKECLRCADYVPSKKDDSPRHPCNCDRWNARDCAQYRRVMNRLENNEPLVEFIGAFPLLFQSAVCVASAGLLRPMPYERFIAWKIKRNLGY